MARWPSCSPSLAIRAVGRSAGTVVQEVRRQFREHPGIMDYTEKPEYGRVISICTAAAQRELATPALLAVLTPVIVGFGINYLALGAFLAAAILTGQLMANTLSNSGGAWDNAKKYIEDGHEGGKGSEAHKAAVIGDTVGDPFKDTAGPALNPLIKVMNLVSLLILPAVITLRHNNGARYAIAGVALVDPARAPSPSPSARPQGLGATTSTPADGRARRRGRLEAGRCSGARGGRPAVARPRPLAARRDRAVRPRAVALTAAAVRPGACPQPMPITPQPTADAEARSMGKALVIVESPAKARTIGGHARARLRRRVLGRPHPGPAPRRRRGAGGLQGRGLGPPRASTSTTASSRSTWSRRTRSRWWPT